MQTNEPLMLDQWRHLTAEQVQKIKKTAGEELLTHCKADPGFAKGVIEAYVARLNVEEQLECISDDAEQQAELLGFEPETGEPALSTDERLERTVEDLHAAASADKAIADLDAWERDNIKE